VASAAGPLAFTVMWFCCGNRLCCGPGSSVGIATELRAGRSGIEYQWRRDFPLTPFWCRGHGRVELYLYPPSGPHRACNGITLPLPLPIYIYIYAVAYPGILFGVGGSTNSAEDRGQRTERTGIWGGGSPVVRGSGGSCNLVQEISFLMVKCS